MAPKPKKPEKEKKPFFQVRGKLYPIPQTYTFGEAESIYEISGLTLNTFLGQLGDGDFHPKALLALVYVLLNRGATEEITVDEIRAINIDELAFVEKEDDGDGPPSEAAAGPQDQTTD